MFDSSPSLGLQLPARRDFLRQAGLGFGSLALASLLHQESPGAAPLANDPLSLKSPHFPRRSNR